jgi:protein-S-isoprenylcysteine O-methyltransferase Ste14
MRTVGLALFWGFTVYAFVLRSGFLKLATGDSGLRGLARDRGALALAAGLLLVPAWLVVGLAPLSAASRPCAAGLPLAIAGAALALWSQREMGLSWRIGVAAGERTTLVTSGPFRWVRNPFFTGMSLVALGTTGSALSGLGVGATVVLLATLVVQVRLVEEPYLAGSVGPAYLAWARRTGRFVPALGRLR